MYVGSVDTYLDCAGVVVLARRRHDARRDYFILYGRTGWSE